MTPTTVLREGTNYVLVEVTDGYQIWDRDDYFSATLRGCPCDLFAPGESGADAAWRVFYELEPAMLVEIAAGRGFDE